MVKGETRKGVWVGTDNSTFIANFHGYHLEHLSGLRKSSSERQKVANNHGS
jgi:hypothetical protein